MTPPVRLRRVAHRGSVVATGFVVDAAVVGLAEARRRVLAVWAPGARVRSADALLIVTELPARRVRAELAPGAPLVDDDGLAVAAPLTADERAQVRAHAPAGSAVVACAGVAVVVDGAALDVAAWIDLGEPALVATTALAAPPVVVGVPVPAALDVRAALGVAPMTAAAAAAAAGLARLRAGDAPEDEPAADAAPSRWQRLMAWIGERLATRPGRGGDGDGGAGGGGGGGAGSAAARASVPSVALARPSWLARQRARLAELLWRSRLGAALGRRHADYLRRMLELFDHGDLDEALRHAIPIGGGDDGPASLGVLPPRPREGVELSLAPRRGNTAIPVGLSATDAIRERYRAALARLIRAERIEEAAFVLADLLGDVAGAAALLERHGRFALAARLAEGHGLEPGLIVRLWWLADERDRAVAAARRHQAWADAVARLERAGEPGADTLRLTWADHLASCGDYGVAVAVTAPVAAARALVLTWIERGLAGGGTVAARLLVTKVVLVPTSFAEVAPAVVAILDDRDDAAVGERRVIAEALLAAPTGPAVATLARATVRALARDVGRGVDGDAPALLPRLVRVADDDALRVDLPPLRVGPRAPALVDRATPPVWRWMATDAGAVPAHDAALLPGGRLLVAMGELGVRMYGRGGAVAAHFDQPATALVVADHGARALALVRRGGYLRVAQLDLATRRGRWWCDAICDGGADTYDGDAWLTSRGGEVLAIDTAAARWTASWGVDTGASTCAITRDGARFAAVVTRPDAPEAWFYDRYVLRQRSPLPDAGPGQAPAIVAVRPVACDALAVSATAPMKVLAQAQAPGCALVGMGWSVALPALAALALVADARFAAVVQRGPTGVVVTIVYVPRRAAVATLELGGATHARVRLNDLIATVADDRGRVIALDLRTGAIKADLRLGA